MTIHDAGERKPIPFRRPDPAPMPSTQPQPLRKAA
jgi:hypothetical protein